MAALPPDVAAVRAAVRRSLTGPAAPTPGDLVLVACSGGPDSTALLLAALAEAPALTLRVGAVTVDHGWSAGSAERAAEVAERAASLGADPAVVCPAVTERSEDAARKARYAVLDRVADEWQAALVLLGHSLDDQAETVLLGLGRGSGGRSLAGMAARRGRFVRPLLGLRRATLRRAAEGAGVVIWDDPANDDRAFTRSRIRHDALPALETALGPGVAEALARTAQLLAADADALDEWVDRVDPGGVDLAVDELAGLPAAVRTRVLRRAALRAGAPAGALSAGHIAEMERLVVDWHGQGPVALPTGILAGRACGRLTIRQPAGSPAAADGVPSEEARARPRS